MGPCVTRFTIYCHTSRTTGKSYIGQTKMTMGRRWKIHVRDAVRNASTRVFARALRKHGTDDWDHEVLDAVATRRGANAAERAWIKGRRTLVPDGYNLSEGGTALATHPETRALIGKASRARYAAMTPEQRREHGIKVNAARTPEERSDIAKRRSAAWTPEERGAMVAKAWANATPEERAARVQNAAAGFSGVARSEALRRRHAAKTPEERSAIIRKGHATRALRASGRVP